MQGAQQEPRMQTAAEINQREFRGPVAASSGGVMPTGLFSLQLGANMTHIAAHKNSGTEYPASDLKTGVYTGLSAYYLRPLGGVGMSVLFMHNTTTDNSSETLAKTNQVFVLANVRHDFRIHSFAPYVMGGIGYDFVDSDTVGSSHMADGASRGSFAAQLGTGVNVFLAPNFSVGIGYSYTKVLRRPNFGIIQNNSILANLNIHLDLG